MKQVLIYLPVLLTDPEHFKRIVFQELVEGNMTGFLPVSNLPLPEDESLEIAVSDAWQEILNHLYLFHFYVNYHRCDKRLVIARLTRKQTSLVRGRRLGGVYLDDKKSVKEFVDLLNSMSAGEAKLSNTSIKVIRFKLPYKYSME